MDTDVSEPATRRCRERTDDEGIFATVAVIGAGAMGSGIAQVAASAGHRVVLVDADAGAAAGARERIAASLDRLVGKGRIAPADARRDAGAAGRRRTRCATCPSAVSSSRRCPRTSASSGGSSRSCRSGSRPTPCSRRTPRASTSTPSPATSSTPSGCSACTSSTRHGHGARRGGPRRADLARLRRARRRRSCGPGARRRCGAPRRRASSSTASRGPSTGRRSASSRPASPTPRPSTGCCASAAASRWGRSS